MKEREREQGREGKQREEKGKKGNSTQIYSILLYVHKNVTLFTLFFLLLPTSFSQD
jgi:hypothetical protein